MQNLNNWIYKYSSEERLRYENQTSKGTLIVRHFRKWL
jgi:hypothetical protein